MTGDWTAAACRGRLGRLRYFFFALAFAFAAAGAAGFLTAADFLTAAGFAFAAAAGFFAAVFLAAGFFAAAGFAFIALVVGAFALAKVLPPGTICKRDSRPTSHQGGEV